MMTTELKNELEERAKQVTRYIIDSPFHQNTAPAYIRDGAILYTKGGGKMLRPTVLLLACEAVGGDPEVALPAAAAVEVSHTWTLVHDDLIDNDDLRRGGPSVHAYYRQRLKDLVANPSELEEVARSMAILVGDTQQAWATGMMNEMSGRVDVEVYRFLVRDLAANWVPKVMEGETLDVEYSKRPIQDVTEAMILRMLDRKTASTFAFAGRVGAMIGLNKVDVDDPQLQALEAMCHNAGVAFQIKDDVLGVVGDEQQLGKPVGSDLREGKKTLIIAHAYKLASEEQRRVLEAVLGNVAATDEEVASVREILRSLGSIEYATGKMVEYAQAALANLSILPDSRAKGLLEQWINFILERNY